MVLWQRRVSPGFLPGLSISGLTHCPLNVDRVDRFDVMAIGGGLLTRVFLTAGLYYVCTGKGLPGDSGTSLGGRSQLGPRFD